MSSKWHGFVAAMLHDIGKLVLDQSGQWAHHEDLNDEEKVSLLQQVTGAKSFQELLGDEIVDLIKNHHEALCAGASAERVAIKCADAISKAIHQVPEPKESDPFKIKFDRLKSNLQFYPYYGRPQRWDKHSAEGLFRKVVVELQKQLDIGTLLRVQWYMINYPHTSYIPHISLALHHRFTAVLFLLLTEELETIESPADLKTFRFCLVRAEPDALDLFYRLRDVEAHRAVFKELVKLLFRKLFKKYAQEIKTEGKKGFGPNTNPFLFFEGDSLVLLYKNPEEVLQALQDSLNEIEGLRSLQVEVHMYEVSLEWNENNSEYTVHAYPEKVGVESLRTSLLSEKTFDYLVVAREQCQACGRPIDESQQDDKGNILCSECFSLRKLSSGIDIDRVALLPDGGISRLAYLFLTLPENLSDYVKEVAVKRLIANFVDDIGLPPQRILPSETGLLEYLQALMELDLFQGSIDLDVGVQSVKEIIQDAAIQDKDSAKVLFSLPSLNLYLLREEECWDFLRRLNRRRFDLHLETGLKVVFCDYRMPFWSLMRSVSRHTPEDTFFDIGRRLVVFNNEEVRQIRELAELARKYRVFPTQLEQISKIALKTNKDELLLELDTRKDKLRELEKPLKDALDKLTASDKEWHDREKRSIFIKYVAKLAKS